MLASVLLIACGDGGPSGLEPSLTEHSPADSPLGAVKGRWDLVSMHEGAAVRKEGCPGPETFVEFRGDGEGGWEMVSQIGEELSILPVLRTERTESGLDLDLGASNPSDPHQRLTITWVEPERIATLSAPFGDRLFVVPSKRDTVPSSPCGG